MLHVILRATIAIGLACLLVACAGNPPVEATAPKELRVIIFPSGANWPLWVAMDKGYLGEERLAAKLTPTPDSAFQMKGLIQGDFDIAMTAVDNVIAYREGQGEAGTTGPDLVAVMGVDTGFLSVVAQPEIQSFTQLRGGVLSVDALTTGYAFVLLEMLERQGLTLGRDYSVERAGGVLQRYQALMEKKHAATLLVTPMDLMAQQRGFNVLGKAGGTIGRYQGSVAAVRQGWARANAKSVSGFIRSYARAIEWLQDPANKEEAKRIYLAHMPPNTPPPAVEIAYQALVVDRGGYQRGAQIDLEGVRTVLRLRAKYAKPAAPLREAADYYDASFYQSASQDHR